MLFVKFVLTGLILIYVISEVPVYQVNFQLNKGRSKRDTSYILSQNHSRDGYKCILLLHGLFAIYVFHDHQAHIMLHAYDTHFQYVIQRFCGKVPI